MPRSPNSKLPKGVRIASETIRGNRYFTVRLGKKFTGRSNTIRRRFSSQKEAVNWILGDAQGERAVSESVIGLQAHHGESAFELTPEQLGEAIWAIKQCETGGVSLTETVKAALQAEKRCHEAGTTLEKALDTGLAHTKPRASQMGFETALHRMLEEKVQDGCSVSHVAELKKKAMRFCRWLPKPKQASISYVSSHDILAYIQAVGKSSGNKKAILRNLSPLFSWSKQNGFIPSNPCKGLSVGRQGKGDTRDVCNPSGERVRVVRFKCSEMRQILMLLRDGFTVTAPVSPAKSDRFHAVFGSGSVTVKAGELVPWFVLGCFAGLRPEEAAKVPWSCIDFQLSQVEVPRHLAKDRQDRFVPMESVLRAWLEPLKRADGDMIPPNFRRKRLALRTKLGWKQWPPDITRHTYGTFHLAKFKDAGKTSENMGHERPKTLRKHYRDAVKDPREADEFWSLTPDSL